MKRCSSPSLLEKLRGLFHRRDCGCDTCGGTVVSPTPAAIEPIAPPKKMPTAPPPPPAPMKQVQIDSGLTPAPVPTIVPGFEPAPAPVPNIDADNKN